MKEKVSFHYFYGSQADQYSFYRIPKALFQNEYFRTLSSDAKILYGLMLDRMSLSIKNHWFDEENRAYIYFSIEDIMELLNCGRNKAVKSLQELDEGSGIGLIEKKRQGFGKTNIIYVKSFMMEESDCRCEDAACGQEEPEEVPATDEPVAEQEAELKITADTDTQKFINQTTEENTDDTEVYISNFKKSQKQTSRSPENKLLEVYISNSNYNNINNTKENYNKSNLIVSDEIRCDSDDNSILQAYGSLIKENIDYDSLLITHPLEKDLVQGIYELILETVLCRNEEILIASNRYPTELVKSKFLKLNYAHVEYAIECFNKSTANVKNIKKYLLAVLFNAPSTIDGYYTAQVHHDMPQLAR